MCKNGQIDVETIQVADPGRDATMSMKCCPVCGWAVRVVVSAYGALSFSLFLSRCPCEQSIYMPTSLLAMHHRGTHSQGSQRGKTHAARIRVTASATPSDTEPNQSSLWEDVTVLVSSRDVGLAGGASVEPAASYLDAVSTIAEATMAAVGTDVSVDDADEPGKRCWVLLRVDWRKLCRRFGTREGCVSSRTPRLRQSAIPPSRLR